MLTHKSLSIFITQKAVPRFYSTKGPSSAVRGAYPGYTIFGENCMLTTKILLPTFRLLKSNMLTVDNSKRGRILLEWTPRQAGGGMARERQVRMGLSAEEVALLVNQIPNSPVEFVRRPVPNEYGPSDFSMGEDAVDKVVRVTPGSGGTVSYQIDYEKNGVRGKGDGPLEVVAQLGEHQVMMELLRSSIPILVGWSTLVDISIEKAIEDAGANGDFSYSGSRDSGVPF